MGLKLTHINLIVENEKKLSAPDVIHIEAEKKKIYGEDDRETGEEKWKVRLNPRFGGDMKFDLTGEELDAVLDDLVKFRGLIKKIEAALGLADRR